MGCFVWFAYIVTMLLMLWFRGPICFRSPCGYVGGLFTFGWYAFEFIFGHCCSKGIFRLKKIILIGMGQPPSRMHHPFYKFLLKIFNDNVFELSCQWDSEYVFLSMWMNEVVTWLEVPIEMHCTVIINSGCTLYKPLTLQHWTHLILG